ncbi:CDP-alcohol phosphatidyltransferase family protein [Rhodoferax saidenbachensis]|uniref:CDP-diacylglycerol--glycerol-3-phosphate 3-phosphatidyltransferase n=1 Tax=Rhodoferax saidenbachensis TaxID=1484693 RepID=A0ABU1ZPI4_9BURK|nr:CDP-alcohol phosphatidyltransferase family protein [Rhodoferax saidenbachensis]MDR7307461.1 CDP-diacylglycerol--glycerol-3-phosphate 3-phosphatidyltransferase [Rhodoferax saidenbachensis]
MRFSVYQLKPRFQQLLQPLLQRLARWGISPNQLTLATMGLMLLYGAALALCPGNPALWVGLPLVLLVRMALNALDGMLANATGQKTRLGAVLNELCDQVSDAALYLPFALAPGVHAGLLVVVVMAASWAEFTGLAALAVGAQRRFDGPMGKSDRAVAFGLLGLMVGCAATPAWTHSLLVVVLVLLGWTVRNRVRAAVKAAD